MHAHMHAHTNNHNKTKTQSPVYIRRGRVEKGMYTHIYVHGHTDKHTHTHAQLSKQAIAHGDSVVLNICTIKAVYMCMRTHIHS